MNPQATYIQTRTDCNGQCVICPQPKAFKRFGLQIMPTALFRKIILDLFEYDYNGIVGLFLQHEPLMESRLFYLIELANKILDGRGIVEISTNGILLNENIDEIKASSVDRVYFNYGAVEHGVADASVVDTVNELSKHIPIRVNYPMLTRDDITRMFPLCLVDLFWASNRGGNIDVNHDNKTKFANRQCQQLNIMANGDVVLCCNDYMRENIFGNAAEENVIDIWRKIPKHFDYPICKRCL